MTEKLKTLYNLYLELTTHHYRYKRFNEVRLTEYEKDGQIWMNVHLNGATAINYEVHAEFDMPESEYDAEIARLRTRIYRVKK